MLGAQHVTTKFSGDGYSSGNGYILDDVVYRLGLQVLIEGLCAKLTHPGHTTCTTAGNNSAGGEASCLLRGNAKDGAWPVTRAITLVLFLHSPVVGPAAA